MSEVDRQEQCPAPPSPANSGTRDAGRAGGAGSCVKNQLRATPGFDAQAALLTPVQRKPGMLPKPTTQPTERTGANASRSLYEEQGDRTPMPSPEVEAEIAGDQARTMCAADADSAAVLAQCLAAQARLPTLISEVGATAANTIAESGAVMKASAQRVVAWASAEHRALLEFFSSYVASLEGGEVSGDALGLVSLFNLFNPFAPLRTLISIVSLGAGYIARDYNRKLGQWRKDATEASFAATAGRVIGVDAVQLETWEAMFDQLSVGSMDVSELAFQTGGLAGGLTGMKVASDMLAGACIDGKGDARGMAKLTLGQLQPLLALETQTREHLTVMRTVPARLSSANDQGLTRLKERYLAWLAGQDDLHAEGTLAIDTQSGGDRFDLELKRVTAVAGVDAAGVTGETSKALLQRPGQFLGMQGRLALMLESTIYTYELEPGGEEDNVRSPVALSDTIAVRVDRDAAKSNHAYARHVQLARLRDTLLARR